MPADSVGRIVDSSSTSGTTRVIKYQDFVCATKAIEFGASCRSAMTADTKTALSYPRALSIGDG
jgi:hypothetical protein